MQDIAKSLAKKIPLVSSIRELFSPSVPPIQISTFRGLFPPSQSEMLIDAMLLNWMKFNIEALLRLELSDMEKELLLDAIKSEFWHWRPSALPLFSKMLALGKLGKVYGKPTVMDIIAFMQVFNGMISEEAERVTIERHKARKGEERKTFHTSKPNAGQMETLQAIAEKWKDVQRENKNIYVSPILAKVKSKMKR